MGRVFSRPGSKFLWVQYYDARGVQIRVSSGETDERKAERFLRRKIGEVAAGVHEDTRRVTYDDLRSAFYRDYEVNARKSLRRDAEGGPWLDKVARLDEFFSGWRASEIDADAIRKFAAEQQGHGLSNASINRSISALRRMFNLARQDGTLRSIPYFPMLRESAPRSGFFERESFEKLSASLPDYLRLPLAIGYFTGMRLSEVLGLRWEQVDFLANTITLRAGETKNDEARTVPVVPQLRAMLLEQRSKRQAGCPFVSFRLDARRRAVRIGGFRKAWYSACVKAGLGEMAPAVDAATGEALYAPPRGPHSKPKPRMIYRGLIFHDLRRTAVRNLVRSGVPERVAMAISGHKTRSVFDRYNIVSQSDLALASSQLAKFHEASQKVGDSSGTESTEMQQVSSSIN
jgi:integrase